ncbi:MAG: ASKHA domain-containing protein [Lachnospiraceae bacterium]|nr:ASKHA domain-containing protein [Lachnospiraceae bacterium]
MDCIGNCIVCGKCKFDGILDNYSRVPAGNEKETFSPRKGLGVAIDLGTTTVVLAVLDLENGQTLSRRSFMNPQLKFGPDIISRINAANSGHLEELHHLIINPLTAEVEAMAKLHAPREITEITIAGNTTMIHLLMGFPCEQLGVSPFKPTHILEDEYRLFGYPARIIPWFSTFVGGDIAAGLLYIGLQQGKRFLLSDLGTNGEMALFDGEKLWVTSAAAGPAFAKGGAGGASAVINTMAGLLGDGMVDEAGVLAANPPSPSPFSQKDIRDIQLAKSAIRSGMEVLLQLAGLLYHDLDSVFLAGGIGQAVNLDAAVKIGLLPSSWQKKTLALGNTSLGGAAHLLLFPTEIAIIHDFIQTAKEINLASLPLFSDYFMKYINFDM